MKRSVLIQIIAAIAGPSLLVGAVYFATNNVLLKKARASAYVATFNENNSPDLDASGNATVTDHRGIIWEYSGAADYANGHIELGHGGYFGIKSTSPYGLKGVEYITVNYNVEENAELWLLKSIDGIDWYETLILEDNTPVEYANNWQFVRFYNYATDGTTSIDIDSVEIGYSCQTSDSASEDVDYTSCYKTLTTSGTTGAVNTTIHSPSDNSEQCLTFTKTGSSSTYAVFELDRVYEVKELVTSKITFDLYKSPDVWKPSVTMLKDSTTVGAEIANNSNSYFFYDLNDNWWRIEVLLNSVISTACTSERGDTPFDVTKTVNKIKIGIGNGTIDNLRFNSKPSRTDEFGLFNKTYVCTIDKTYWVKISWAGSLHECTFAYGTSGIVSQFYSTTSKFPFYIRGDSVGKTTITPTFTLGYNRQNIVTMTKPITTITVNN